nr:oxidative stress response two-component system protein ssk1 [Quercus suber]
MLNDSSVSSSVKHNSRENFPPSRPSCRPDPQQLPDVASPHRLMARFAFRPSRFFRRTISAQTDRETTATTSHTNSTTSSIPASPSTSPHRLLKSVSGSCASRSLTQLHRHRPDPAATKATSTGQDVPSAGEDDAGEEEEEEEEGTPPVHGPTVVSRKASSSQADEQTLSGSELELNLDHKFHNSPVIAPVPAVVVEHPTPDAAVTQQIVPSEIQPSVKEAIVGSLRQQGLLDDPNASPEVLSEGVEQPETTATDAGTLPTPAASVPDNYFSPSAPTMAHPTHRKIWVKRPGASATLVKIKEDDLVDDVRDMILQKYANSLGKTFDAPDMTLRINQRTDPSGVRHERILGPEEEICQALDACYVGGQTVEEALIIDVPHKRTPRASPRIYQNHTYHLAEDQRPHENGSDYFPPMPVLLPSTTPQTTSSHESRHLHANPHLEQLPRSMSVLNTGQLPPLPSPGTTRRHRETRPSNRRHPTSSPTLLTFANVAAAPANVPNSLNPLIHRQMTSRPRNGSTASDAQYLSNGGPAPPPLPTPPIPEVAAMKNGSRPPTPNGITAVHPHRVSRPPKKRKSTPDRAPTKSHQPNGAGLSNLGLVNSMLDGAVPPINVLIVEDNIINLRILESLMKRLKVRWQTAMNGQIAVDKWKAGGFHLVLMDIQMPIMNGLQATKEIRRLERVNGIGVFSTLDSPAPSAPDANGEGKAGSAEDQAKGEGEEKDKAESDKLVLTGGLFKSPIIIVALTASSLQSDRHEALAAGCNDFLTKPVDFMWLERKVKEWGCMQALIDFDGWRKWKDYATEKENAKSAEEKQADREKEAKARVRAEKMALLQEKQRLKKEQEERKKKRQSADPVAPIAETGEEELVGPTAAAADGTQG